MLVPVLWTIVGASVGALLVWLWAADSYTRGVRDTLMAVNAHRMTEALPRYVER